jgi:hypothetical protein
VAAGVGGGGSGQGGGVLWGVFAVWVGGLCGGGGDDLWEAFAGVGGEGDGGVGRGWIRRVGDEGFVRAIVIHIRGKAGWGCGSHRAWVLWI